MKAMELAAFFVGEMEYCMGVCNKFNITNFPEICSKSVSIRCHPSSISSIPVCTIFHFHPLPLLPHPSCPLVSLHPQIPPPPHSRILISQFTASPSPQQSQSSTSPHTSSTRSHYGISRTVSSRPCPLRALGSLLRRGVHLRIQ